MSSSRRPHPSQPVQSRFLASYGRKRGRRLGQDKQRLVDELLPQMQVTLPSEGKINLEDVFKSCSPLGGEQTRTRAQHAVRVVGGRVCAARNTPHPNPPPQGGRGYFLEIGFGTGTHLAQQARLHPQAGLIGCEPYLHGIGELLRLVERDALSNIRLFTGDARLLIEKLPDCCLDKVFIYYPDPWPKARHHKRRLISQEFLTMLARVMKPGAELRLATDDAGYCTCMLEQLLVHPDFSWQARRAADWKTPPANWQPTRYEKKARKAGRQPAYLNFRKI